MKVKVELEDDSSELDVLDITFVEEPDRRLWVDFHVVTQHEVLGHIRIPAEDIVRITEA